MWNFVRDLKDQNDIIGFVFPFRESAFLLWLSPADGFSIEKYVHFYLYINWPTLIISPKIESSSLFIFIEGGSNWLVSQRLNISAYEFVGSTRYIYRVEVLPLIFRILIQLTPLASDSDYRIRSVWNDLFFLHRNWSLFFFRLAESKWAFTIFWALIPFIYILPLSIASDSPSTASVDSRRLL